MKKILVLVLLSILTAWPVLARTPNDEYLKNQWYLETVGAYQAWDTTVGSNEVVVAVLDTGIDLDHPDLADHFWINLDEVASDGIDNDNNGFIDDVGGWDFVTSDNDPSPEISAESFDADAISHGTFLAGIIGAETNNGQGIAGLNWHIKIMPVRILDRFGSGDSSRARKAVDYAVKNGADIINFSFTGTDLDPAFLESVRQAYNQNVVIVAAVGNESLNVNNEEIYPVCFESTENSDDYVIGVAASDTHDKWADFSNYGSNCVDISAPGVNVFSTLFQQDGYVDFLSTYGGGWDGTSVATPVVTGAVALLKSAFPNITPAEVKIVLQLSADPLAERNSKAVGQLGAGRLNIAKALELAPSFVSSIKAGVAKAPSGFLAIAPASGSSLVRTFDSAGNKHGEFYAYDPSFGGGVRVAIGDVNGDGVDEIVTGPGFGGGPQVRIFTIDGQLLGQFFAYSSFYTQGIFVGTGDLNGDDIDEILVSPDQGGNGEVRWFEMNGEQDGFIKPFGTTQTSLRVAAGDVDGDGQDEIIVGTGSGVPPTVKIFKENGTVVNQFSTYATTYDKGIYVEAGDLDGDGSEEIITGTDYGGGPHVRIFKADGSVVSSFFAYEENFRGGVRVAVADLDNNGSAEIYTAAGPGGGPHVRVFNLFGQAIGGFFPFEESLKNGIFVAGW